VTNVASASFDEPSSLPVGRGDSQQGQRGTIFDDFGCAATRDLFDQAHPSFDVERQRVGGGSHEFPLLHVVHEEGLPEGLFQPPLRELRDAVARVMHNSRVPQRGNDGVRKRWCQEGRHGDEFLRCGEGLR
jgi:hypothetical protein